MILFLVKGKPRREFLDRLCCSMICKMICRHAVMRSACQGKLDAPGELHVMVQLTESCEMRALTCQKMKEKVLGVCEKGHFSRTIPMA